MSGARISQKYCFHYREIQEPLACDMKSCEVYNDIRRKGKPTFDA
jgi:hypothetical protein